MKVYHLKHDKTFTVGFYTQRFEGFIDYIEKIFIEPSLTILVADTYVEFEKTQSGIMCNGITYKTVKDCIDNVLTESKCYIQSE